jgi:hypothetical protein
MIVQWMIAVSMEFREFSTLASENDGLVKQELKVIDELKIFAENDLHLSQEYRKNSKTSQDKPSYF